MVWIGMEWRDDDGKWVQFDADDERTTFQLHSARVRLVTHAIQLRKPKAEFVREDFFKLRQALGDVSS